MKKIFYLIVSSACLALAVAGCSTADSPGTANTSTTRAQTGGYGGGGGGGYGSHGY